MTPGPPVRVLVVDDVSGLRLVVRHTLERHPGFTIVGEAADGAESVRVAAETQPDIILLDVDMPGVNGIDALPELRAAAPGAKVIVLSGLTRQPTESLARTAGAVGYLEKGIRARRLVDELVAVAGLLETVEDALAETRLVLVPETRAPGTARHFVDETLRRWDCADALDTIKLLVSELVTNAVLHARSESEVAVLLHRDTIRVEVADGSGEPPQPRAATAKEVSGRGLELVRKLSTAWGVRASERGKVVWFEVPRLDAAGDGAVIA